MSSYSVKLAELADIFQVTDRRIQQYCEEGMPKMARGEYDLAECARWLVNYWKEKYDIAENSGDEKLHHLKMEGQRIYNRERELKYKRLLGELVSFSETKIAWVNEVLIFRKALDSMGQKLMVALEHVHDGERKREIIFGEIREVKQM